MVHLLRLAMHLRTSLPLVFASIVLSARGQFYAPETEYHDISQREFPVEAARVLAWHRAANGQQPAVAEVKYELSLTPARETVWKIQWLDATKKTVREKEVRYPESQLTAGPDYYRGVFTQLEGGDWKIPAVSPDNAATTFWQGAELSGVTRLDGIKAASTLLHDKPKMARAADAARMAGILSHATIPRFTRQTSIDTVLLARAATWLCIAEAKSHEKFDASWISILFLSGREKSAAELSPNALWRSAGKQNAAERFWQTLASRPSAKEMFLFAGRTENKTVAMPMMSYVGSLDPSLATTAAEVADDFLGGAALERMSEYSPNVAKSDSSKIAAGTSGALADFLAKWEQSLADFQPAELDYSGYRDVAKTLPARAANETQMAMLQRLSPLLNLGVDQAAGPLVPTAHVTSRDLLSLGWETACLLSSIYYEALNQPGANPDSAKVVVSTVLGSIKGSNLFFADTDAKALAPIDSPARVQYVGSPHAQKALFKKLPASWTGTPEMPLKRQWLNRAAMNEAVAHMVEAKAPEAAFKENVERLARESGTAIARDLTMKEPAPKFAEAIDRIGVRESIERGLPDLAAVDPATLMQEVKSVASASPSSPSAAEVVEKLDFSKLKTAEEFWAALEKLREIPRPAANSPEDRMRQIRSWLDSRLAASEAFLKTYPNDPHRHSARLMAIDSVLQLTQFGEKGISKIERNDLEAIINAPDADEETKGEAEFFKLMVDSQSVEFNSPHTVPPFQQALSSYLEKYPKHVRSQYVASMLMQTLSQFETPSTEPLLKKLATHSNPGIAGKAKAILQQRQFMLDLKKKPLLLKFTGVDGTEVDASKLRGKVLLLDFWASWCGPCMADVPHVVATYQKLRDRGFEIIGISLDQDKAAMEEAMKKNNMTWPQYFDGKGWQNEISEQFGVRSIPSTWLFDRKGKLREHGLRGQELEMRIENLLKEK
jgi:thiol-disulfide isomerase/thioredoxin